MTSFGDSLLFVCGLFLLCVDVSGEIQLSHKQISPFLTLTLVHGDPAALMTHAEAREFCANLSLASVLPSNTVTPSDGNSPENGSPSSRVVRIRSDLISIHAPAMMHEIMSWVLPLEKRQFWIGGRVTKSQQQFDDQAVHLLQKWTDGTSANYRFLDIAAAALEQLPEGQVLCISVDYASGKWGAHDCEEKMYFLCETITLPGKVSKKYKEKDSKTETENPGQGQTMAPIS